MNAPFISLGNNNEGYNRIMVPGEITQPEPNQSIKNLEPVDPPRDPLNLDLSNIQDSQVPPSPFGNNQFTNFA